jgi:hypothetical protein
VKAETLIDRLPASMGLESRFRIPNERLSSKAGLALRTEREKTRPTAE